MLKIGITGGIGSGKTTVCKLFAFFGIPTYSADTEAKRLMIEQAEIRSELKQLFGNDIYLPDGTLDKTRLAKIIFNDTTMLAQVNAIVHPRVQADFEAWAQQQTSAFVLKEAAILFESGSHKQLDKTILVTAPEALRIRRVVQRDKTNEEAVRARIKNQWPDEKKMALADLIVHNDNTQLLLPQVHSIVKNWASPTS